MHPNPGASSCRTKNNLQGKPKYYIHECTGLRVLSSVFWAPRICLVSMRYANGLEFGRLRLQWYLSRAWVIWRDTQRWQTDRSMQARQGSPSVPLFRWLGEHQWHIDPSTRQPGWEFSWVSSSAGAAQYKRAGGKRIVNYVGCFHSTLFHFLYFFIIPKKIYQQHPNQ